MAASDLSHSCGQGGEVLFRRRANGSLRPQVTRRHLVAGAAVIVTLIAAWWLGAYPRGMAAAHIDLARGRYEVLTFGLPPSWDREYRRLLKERYGVEVHTVAGCMVTEEEVWFVDGYNSVAEARITSRFGKDVFAECAADARASSPGDDRKNSRGD